MKNEAGQPPNYIDLQKLRKPTDEELQVYHSCISSSYFTAGIPFALLTYYLSNKKKPGTVQQPRPFAKNAVLFFANSIIGSMFFLPICYTRFSAIYMKNIKKEQEEEGGGIVPATQITEGTLPPTTVEDFSYPIDAATHFNEPESNFSGDFNYPRLLDDDPDHLSAKPSTTTYSDLRAKHRNEQKRPTTTPGSSLNMDSRRTYSTPSSQIEDTKPRPVKKNMYGDEIE